MRGLKLISFFMDEMDQKRKGKLQQWVVAFSLLGLEVLSLFPSF